VYKRQNDYLFLKRMGYGLHIKACSKTTIVITEISSPAGHPLRHIYHHTSSLHRDQPDKLILSPSLATA